MKKILLAGTALALLPATLLAQEPPTRVANVTPPLIWTGYYIGGQFGLVRSRATLSGIFDDPFGGISIWSSTQAWTSFLLGGFAGYDYQFGRWVVGIEGDVNARFTDGTGSLPSVYGIYVTRNWKSEAKWDASLRARFGALATERLLLYLTGGVAFSHFTFSNPAVLSEFNVYWGTRNLYGGNRVGWTFGGGVQYALNRHWHVRFEFRHTDYGKKSLAGFFDIGKGAGPGSVRSKIVDDRGVLGIVYKY